MRDGKCCRAWCRWGRLQAAIKFYLDLSAFQRERELYTQPALREMMPATLAIDDNASGECATPYGYVFPPFVIIECGQSLDEWARRNQADFVTIFQVQHSTRMGMQCMGTHGRGTAPSCGRQLAIASPSRAAAVTLRCGLLH